MTTIIVVLLTLAKWFWHFARKPHRLSTRDASNPSTEPLTATPDDEGLSPEHPLASHFRCETPVDRDGSSDALLEREVPGEDRRPAEASAPCAESPPDSAAPEFGSSLSGSDTGDGFPPSFEEVEPNEPSAAAPPTDDVGHPESGETKTDGDARSEPDGDSKVGRPRQRRHKPPRISGRRDRQPGNADSERRQSPSSRPELVCREVHGRAAWEVILTADEACRLSEVRFQGEDRVLPHDGEACRVPSLTGRLAVSCQDGRQHDLPLFEGEPLIFKLRKDWAGKGRRISRITRGHFIVIAPKKWERTGHAPVEAHGCKDPEFRAHYFCRDENRSNDGGCGFRQWNGSLVATGIEPTGQRVFDDSDEGDLFVGEAPVLEPSPEIAWTRVGEEAENGWGENFRPDEQSLAEVLGGREGRFFLRVYDSEVSLRDSSVFRYWRNLSRIHVNGTEYTQDTVLAPTPTGYPDTEVRFVAADGSTLSPTLSPDALQSRAPSGAINVPRHPDADRISCGFETDGSGVSILLDLPRIWWRLEDGWSDPGEWQDTPLVMTREVFRKRADAQATISLLSKRFSRVRAGFDDEWGQQYDRRREEDRIAIPLFHFVDHKQIDLRLSEDARFNVEWAGKIVTLMVISADPKPAIVSFIAKPARIVAGQEAILEWTTRNASDARAAIDQDIGKVESCGTCVVHPTETSGYTLTLSASGTEDVRRAVTVGVDSPPAEPGGLRAALVMSSGCKWRDGKGFSFRELQDAGVTVKEAAERSIPIDKRRRSSHSVNVQTIRRLLDA